MATEDDAVSTLNETFAALHTLLLSLSSVDEFLQDLASLAADIAAPVVSCGITVEYDTHPLTVSSSDSWSLSLDEVQYELDDGPCLQAMRTGTVVHVTDLTTEHRWPRYTELARTQGLRESLSLPLVVGGAPAGAVNLYTREPDGLFQGEVRQRADLFVAQASTALLLATRQLRQSQTNQDLEAALSSRSVIDQAMGILMGQQACGPTEAFDLLRKHSQNSNRRLRDVAAELVGRASRRH